MGSHRKTSALISFVVAIMMSFTSIAGAQTASLVFDLDHSDPASDVEWLFPNMTKELHDAPKDFNLKRLTSEDKGDTVVITLELVGQGKIRNDDNTTYSIQFARVNNTTADMAIEYTNGDCVAKELPSGAVIEITTTCKVVQRDKHNQGDLLEVTVSKTVFDGALCYEASGKVESVGYRDDLGVNVTYSDYVWELSGNPGSTPEDPPSNGGGDDDDVPGYLVATAAILVLLALLAIVLIFMMRRKK